jgi:hypothetical protein
LCRCGRTQDQGLSRANFRASCCIAVTLVELPEAVLA